MKRPHILFILSDQHNSQVMGNAGDPHVVTPNLDNLASEGSSFSNCYCASPICVASRSSLLSGLLPSKTGVFSNQQCLRSDQATFVHSLGAVGYETVLCGRMHFNGPDQRHGFEKRLVGDVTPGYPVEDDSKYGELRGTTGQDRTSVEKSGPGFSSVIGYDQEVTAEACRFLDERTDTRPLFLTVGFYGPHCPYVCPKELFDMYYDNLPVPDDVVAPHNAVHPAIRNWLELRRVTGVEASTARRVRAAYYGLVSLMDIYIGQILEKAYRQLGKENVLVIYTSDHGEMMGEKGMYWKSSFFEGAVRVPFICSWPGVLPEGRNVSVPVSLLDIGPTLIDVVQAFKLPDFDGISLREVLYGKQHPDEDRTIISQLGGSARGDKPSAMIRKGDWKLISHVGYETPQLFNLRLDPKEYNDLGEDTQYTEIGSQLLKELAKCWDAESVVKQVESNAEHLDLLRKWAKSTNIEGIEEWKGDPEKNFIFQDQQEECL